MSRASASTAEDETDAPEEKRKVTAINVTLPEKLYDQFLKDAEDQDITPAQLVRNMLSEHLGIEIEVNQRMAGPRFLVDGEKITKTKLLEKLYADWAAANVPAAVADAESPS